MGTSDSVRGSPCKVEQAEDFQAWPGQKIVGKSTEQQMPAMEEFGFTSYDQIPSHGMINMIPCLALPVALSPD